MGREDWRRGKGKIGEGGNVGREVDRQGGKEIGKKGEKQEMERLGKLRSGGKGEDCEGNGKVERKRGRLRGKDKNKDQGTKKGTGKVGKYRRRMNGWGLQGRKEEGKKLMEGWQIRKERGIQGRKGLKLFTSLNITFCKTRQFFTNNFP